MPRTAHARPPVDSSLAQPATESEWRAGCDRCGTSYTLASWRELTVVGRVEPSWLATHVMDWRTDDVIEVRRCARCTTAMSRRRPSEPDEIPELGRTMNASKGR